MSENTTPTPCLIDQYSTGVRIFMIAMVVAVATVVMTVMP